MLDEYWLVQEWDHHEGDWHDWDEFPTEAEAMARMREFAEQAVNDPIKIMYRIERRFVI